MRLAPLISLALVAAPATALELADCDRITHPSHGGEAAHRAYGGTRVGYVEWWSQEGVYTDFVVADCATGEALTTRAREERIYDRPPFDRTDAVARVIETEMGAAPSLFSFDRLARTLDGTGRDTVVAMLDSEPCACAVLHPDARSGWAPYEAAR